MWDKKMKFIDIVKIYNKSFTWSLAIVMCYLFMKAWQNNYVWSFHINLYGEAIVEAVMIFLWLISILLLTIKDLRREK